LFRFAAIEHVPIEFNRQSAIGIWLSPSTGRSCDKPFTIAKGAAGKQS